MNWRDGPRLPVAAAGGFAASLPDEVVYAGGTSWRTGAKEYLDDVHIYKWRGNSWRAGPKLPSSLAYGACVVTPAGLEILGGLDGNASTDKCWRLDHKKHAWLPSGVLPRDAVLARAAVVRNEVYLFGGAKDAADLTTCTAEVLTRDSSGKWHTVGLMPQGAVANAASAVIGNMVYLFGGVSMPAAGKVLNHADVLRFDAAEHTWRRLAPLPEPNRGETAVGRLYGDSGGGGRKNGGVRVQFRGLCLRHTRRSVSEGRRAAVRGGRRRTLETRRPGNRHRRRRPHAGPHRSRAHDARLSFAP